MSLRGPRLCGDIPLCPLVNTHIHHAQHLCVRRRAVRPPLTFLPQFVTDKILFLETRVVIFTLRAKQAKTPAQREDKNLTLYWQITFATGYISLYVTAVKALQCLLVGSTMGSAPGTGKEGATSTDIESGETVGSPALDDAEPTLKDSVEEPDLPERRKLYRGTFIALSLQSWVAVSLGIIAGQGYVVATMDAAKVSGVRDLRYNFLSHMSLWRPLIMVHEDLPRTQWHFPSPPQCRASHSGQRSAYHASDAKTRRFSQRCSYLGSARSSYVPAFFPPPLLFLLTHFPAQNTISVYRFAVLGNNTSALLSTAPESLNSPRDKALFYVFQAVPELLAAAVLLCVDVRRMFGTGPWGDRLWDPKAKA